MKEQKTAAAAAATTGVVERRSAEARAAERPQVAGEQGALAFSCQNFSECFQYSCKKYI